MRRSKATAFLSVALLLAAVGARVSAAGNVSYYYSVSLGSFSSGVLQPAEYSDLSASIEWGRGEPMNMAFSMHYLLPVNPLSFEASFAGLGADLTLFYLQKHPLRWLSPRKTALAPMIGVAAFAPVTDLRDLRYTLAFSPFRLYSGYGYFSLGAFSLVFDGEFSQAGWGLKLFEFSYLVF